MNLWVRHPWPGVRRSQRDRAGGLRRHPFPAVTWPSAASWL